MKTIVRIGEEDAKLAPLGTAMVAETFIKRKAKEAVLVVEQTKEGPVYIVVGPHPPEIAHGDRRVFAVFSPPVMQEPIATFADEAAAKLWAINNCQDHGYDVRQIDSTDRVGMQVHVAVVIRRGSEGVLYCHLTKSGQWAIPAGPLMCGETVAAAAERIGSQLGLKLQRIGIPAQVPYVNIYDLDRGHFVTLVMVAETTDEPALKDREVYDLTTWAESPPEPAYLTVKAIQKVASDAWVEEDQRRRRRSKRG